MQLVQITVCSTVYMYDIKINEQNKSIGIGLLYTVEPWLGLGLGLGLMYVPTRVATCIYPRGWQPLGRYSDLNRMLYIYKFTSIKIS